MTHYELWVFLHVASVIVWIGAGTTLALATLYAQRADDPRLLGAVTGLAGWLGPRVFGPSSLAALVFGIVAARSAHWGVAAMGQPWHRRVRRFIPAQRCRAIAAVAAGPPWWDRGSWERVGFCARSPSST
jgi:hypothetical protein